jgi:succinate dehydrogenase/fumarate reductase cytochrome b subunit
MLRTTPDNQSIPTPKHRPFLENLRAVHGLSLTAPQRPIRFAKPRVADRLAELAPAAAAICYPFALQAYNLTVTASDIPVVAQSILAGLLLAACLAVPLLGITLACREHLRPAARRLAYASIFVPPLYVFVGLVQHLSGSTLPDQLPWCALWAVLAVWSQTSSSNPTLQVPTPNNAWWRVYHGFSGAVITVFVIFHLGNHLFGLMGPEAHTAIADIGRKVYRGPVIEPVLVVLFALQILGGLHLAWKWTAYPRSFQETVQIGTGLYLSVFLISHMSAVFILARTVLGIPTDWAFATGAHTGGIIHNAWNIRLLPHYALGVFFVLCHLAAGLRVVLIAHGTAPSKADRIWAVGACASALIAAVIGLAVSL